MTDDNNHQAPDRSSYRPALVYAVLLAIGVPWYWPTDMQTIILGVPAWVIGTIVVSVVASTYTAIQFSKRWPGEDTSPEDSP